jgi:DNA ligase 1
MRREFVQLANVFDPKKHGIAGWFVSEKLDGMRALWDGGISRGLVTSDVPWANTAKERTPQVCTGLWSRYGKPIQAPDYWLDCLPTFPLDGELWTGRGQFQTIIGITKRTVNILDTEWKDVKYMVFDSPTYDEIFIDGEIKTLHYNKMITSHVKEWVKSRLFIDVDMSSNFELRFKFLKRELEGNKVIVVHDQLQLPHNTPKAQAILDQRLLAVSQLGGEGLMLRSPVMPWFPKRGNNILKIKPLHDAEATVVGYRCGKVGKEGKHLGRLGSLVVNFNGKIFDIGGFTDEERILSDPDWAMSHPGEVCPREITSSVFPHGSTITFTYREFTDDGIPKEARYLRPGSGA